MRSCFASLTLQVICFYILSSTYASADTYVEWNNYKIKFDELQNVPNDDSIRGPIEEAALKDFPRVDCIFESKKTLCYQLYRENADEPYGTNLKFVVPKARLPPLNPLRVSEDDESDAEADIDPSDPTGVFDGNTPIREILKSIPIYHFVGYSKVLSRNIIEHNLNSHLSVDITYALATSTEGGDSTLEMWNGLIGYTPKRTCMIYEDFCSIVLRATRNGNPALVRCSITNSIDGQGMPFLCSLVAFEGKAGWYIQSYSGPGKCDGCGAGAGASCYVNTSNTPAEIARTLIAIIKRSRMNLQLRVIPLGEDEKFARKRGVIRISGKHISQNSQFYSGYYESADAFYNIENTVGPSGEGNWIEISGLYTLLVGADPSNDPSFYRDISSEADFPLEWLQDQVINIFKTELSQELRSEVTCENIGYMEIRN